jgi:hypothetical protein
MTIVLILIPPNLKEWNALCVITSNKKKTIKILHKVGKVLLNIIRTMAQLPWVVMFLLNTLQFFLYIKHDNNLLLPWCLLITILLKRGRNQLQVPLLVFLTLESFTKNLTLFRNNSLKIWCFTLPSFELHWKCLVEKAYASLM